MEIPTKNQCYRMLCEMKMMDHIVVHSLQVCRVATFLTEHLNKQNYRLNFEMIQSAALLHDITKTRSFKTRENHAQTGGQLVAEQGYPQVGELIRQHVKLDEYPDPPVLGEAQIINYADKRVLHDKVVSLEKRLEYIHKKYAQTSEDWERIDLLWQKTKCLEDRIFSQLPFMSKDLSRLISSGNPSAGFSEYQMVCRNL